MATPQTDRLLTPELETHRLALWTALFGFPRDRGHLSAIVAEVERLTTALEETQKLFKGAEQDEEMTHQALEQAEADLRRLTEERDALVQTRDSVNATVSREPSYWANALDLAAEQLAQLEPQQLEARGPKLVAIIANGAHWHRRMEARAEQAEARLAALQAPVVADAIKMALKTVQRHASYGREVNDPMYYEGWELMARKLLDVLALLPPTPEGKT